jgi:hypothetical protein
MSPQIREQIENLVNEAWELHDQATTEDLREKLKTDIFELLSRLPENVEHLKIMQ